MRILFAMRDDGDMTEPMNTMLLSALAKALGHTTGLWVMEQQNMQDRIRGFKPDIVASSCITGSHRYYIEAAEKVKRINPSIKTIFGGPHFTFFPGEILKNDYIDAICVGEGDDAWPAWLNAIEAGRTVDDIPNIITRTNASKVLVSSSLGLVLSGFGQAVLGQQNISPDSYIVSPRHLNPRRVNLDSLPFMDRGLVYDTTEFKNRFKRTHMASRGCPFKCTYCFEHQWNELYKSVGTGISARIRQWYSVDRFLDELEYIKKNWDTRFIKLYDDVMLPFPNDDEIAWHEEFCSKYPKRVGLPFHLLTRCDLVVRLKTKGIDVIADWKKAGMASMTMSIESGNAFIRDQVITRDMTGFQIEEAFKIAYAAGIYTFPNVILGIPAPLLPYPDDSDFDQKMQRVVEEVKILQKLNGRRIDVEKAMKFVREWSMAESDYRRHLVTFLRGAGLRHSYIEYEKESVQFTLDQRPGFPEFPILAPFPKTKATEWCETRGDFDGDYNKLHASYQHRSVLTCYDEREKTVQQNLALLGSFLALFAGSRNPVVRTLDKPMRWLCLECLSEIKSSWATKIFGWLYTVSKAYMHQRRIYPIRYTFREKVRFYGQMVTLDLWKQFRHKHVYRANRPGQTLGGPVSL